ncbi:hypothetical protein HOG21_01155 [bacterium]|nr:hypothetical protein [bacterium]
MYFALSFVSISCISTTDHILTFSHFVPVSFIISTTLSCHCKSEILNST